MARKLQHLFLFLFFPLFLSGCKVSVFITGDGTVTAIEPDISQCQSAPACFKVERGNALTLLATPTEGYEFAGWGGACAGQSGNQCALTVNGDTRVQASFHKLTSFNVKPLMQPETAYYFTAPWPNDAYSTTSAGFVDANHFPLPDKAKLSADIKKLAATQKGFSTNGGVYFQFDRDYLGYVFYNDLDRYDPLDNGISVAFFLNVDTNSPHYGSVMPAWLNEFDSSDPEQNGLLLVAVKPGFTLLPNTKYAAILLKHENHYGSLAASDTLSHLTQAYDPRLGYSPSLFNALVEQKSLIDATLTMSGVASPEQMAAFSVFTTQDPQRTDRAVGNALKKISDEQIIDSISAIRLVQDCNEGALQGSKHIALSTQLPNFLTGAGLRLLGGGKIEESNDAAVIQDYQATDLLLSVPCTPPPPRTITTIR